MDREELLDKLFEQEIGVTAEKHVIYSLDEYFPTPDLKEDLTLSTQ